MIADAVLERLVALNAERAAEEARGLIRWLRPELQNRSLQEKPRQEEMDTDAAADADADAGKSTSADAVHGKPKQWPKDPLEQVRAVAEVLTKSAMPLGIDDVAAHFTSRGAWKKRIEPLLDMLVALGRASEKDGLYRARA